MNTFLCCVHIIVKYFNNLLTLVILCSVLDTIYNSESVSINMSRQLTKITIETFNISFSFTQNIWK